MQMTIWCAFNAEVRLAYLARAHLPAPEDVVHLQPGLPCALNSP